MTEVPSRQRLRKDSQVHLLFVPALERYHRLYEDMTIGHLEGGADDLKLGLEREIKDIDQHSTAFLKRKSVRKTA